MQESEKDLNKKPRKILLAITKSSWGGAQRYVYDLAVGLRDAGDDVVVVCGGDGLLTERLNDANIRVLTINRLGRDISFKDDMNAMREFARIIRAEKPDVLHINSAKIGGLGAFLGRLLRVPRVVFTAHGWAFNESRPHWQKFIIRLASWATVLLAHRTILVSKETGRQLGAHFLLPRCSVVYNGFTSDDYLTREDAREALIKIRPDLETCRDDPWTMSIGELHPIKGHDLMIDAVSMLVKQSLNVRHMIIGGGEIRENLELKIAEAGLAGNIFLFGNIPQASKYIRAADIFVLPSRSEALPYVLIEACGAGVPVIATAVGGVPEVITNDKDGILVPPGNPKNFFHAITHLLEDDELRTRIAAGAKIRAADFSLEKMISRTRAVYSAIE